MKGLRILLFAVILSFLIGLLGLGQMIKSINNDVYIKDAQINVLATEIGSLKDENQFLYEKVLATRDFTNHNIQALKDSISRQLMKELNENSTLQNELNTIQSSLTSELSNKNLTLDELRQRNNGLMASIETLNQNSDITNILILGINQKLTDTIIIASINPSQETISLISVPRDLWLNGRKINSIYASYGIEKLLKDLKAVTSLHIEKYAIVDFDAFKNMIDILDGIDLYVNEDIYDSSFPTYGSGYTIYSINKGSHHFDGEEALRYSRSRKSTSDFDRSKRQQQVIQAIRVKLKKFELLENLDKAMDIYSNVVSKIESNIDVFESLFYLKNYQSYAIESNNVLSTSNLLYSTRSIDGQYILLPKSNDYSAIQNQISKLINN